jgi:AAA+ superfamily predicted ATPase
MNEYDDYSTTLLTTPTDTLGWIEKRLYCLAMRRVCWLKSLLPAGSGFQKFVVNDEEVQFILEEHDHPEALQQWIQSDPTAIRLTEELENIEKHIAADRDGRFTCLIGLFGLDARESDLLQLCLTVFLKPAFRRVCAYLDPFGRSYVTEELAGQLFDPEHGSILTIDSPLLEWNLVHRENVGPGERELLRCDAPITHWLQGRDYLHDSIRHAARLGPAPRSLGTWPVRQTAERIQEHRSHGPVRVVVAGTRGSGRSSFAASVCARLNLPLLTVDTDALEWDDAGHSETYVRRQALLMKGAVAWSGSRLEALRRHPARPELQFVIAEPEANIPPLPGVRDINVEIGPLTLDQSCQLWKSLVPAARSWRPEELSDLATQYQLTVGEITTVADHDVETVDQARLVIQQRARHSLDELARWVPCSFTWDDVVLNQTLVEALKDFTYEAKERAAFWERPEAKRIFPYGRGLIGLCSGPPGTGKTMSAQVIAAQLRLDLFKVNLSSVISKYVGETAKNLSRILTRAAQMNCVLLCDEADALFAKRTEVRDAHDRFANTDTDALLQDIEDYPGVVLLSTNEKSHMDPAFIRRMRYYFEFTKPDSAQRLVIWQKIVAALLGPEARERLAGSLRVLSDEVELTGSQIKYATLAAIFIAGRGHETVAPRHLVAGLARELAKEGRGLSLHDTRRLIERG